MLTLCFCMGKIWQGDIPQCSVAVLLVLTFLRSFLRTRASVRLSFFFGNVTIFVAVDLCKFLFRKC